MESTEAQPRCLTVCCMAVGANPRLNDRIRAVWENAVRPFDTETSWPSFQARAFFFYPAGRRGGIVWTWDAEEQSRIAWVHIYSDNKRIPSLEVMRSILVVIAQLGAYFAAARTRTPTSEKIVERLGFQNLEDNLWALALDSTWKLGKST